MEVRTQHQTAKALGLTRDEVRTAEANALRKLRDGLKAHGLDAGDYELLALVLCDLSAELMLMHTPHEGGAGVNCLAVSSRPSPQEQRECKPGNCLAVAPPHPQEAAHE